MADAVLNHMAGEHQQNGVNGRGTIGNCNWNANDHQESFPCVPYTASDFHDSICDHNINNYASCWEVQLKYFTW